MAVAKADHGVEIVPDDSPAYESPSSGFIENCCGAITAQTRVLKHATEELHGVKDTALVGVNFHRANRRVSERPLTWHFGLGADRLKYTRVNIDFPANKFDDETF